jgi:hypothetical protein
MLDCGMRNAHIGSTDSPPFERDLFREMGGSTGATSFFSHATIYSLYGANDLKLTFGIVY